MIIAGYEKTSLIEWPGKIASVIFTQGCNFKCPFCHNADLVQSRRAGEQESKRWAAEEILEDLRRRKGWLDAVVVTGGEPTLQKDLPEFLESLGRLGLLRMVHTNGTNPEVVKKLIDEKLVNYWGMDLKSNFDNYFLVQNSPPKADLLQRGMDLGSKPLVENIKLTISLIIGSGVEYEFRTTVVPGMHTLENLKELAKEIREVADGTKVLEGEEYQNSNDKIQIYKSNSKSKIQNETRFEPKWYLQQFRPINCLDKSYLKKKPFSKEEMESFQKELQKIVPQTYLRGV